MVQRRNEPACRKVKVCSTSAHKKGTDGDHNGIYPQRTLKVLETSYREDCPVLYNAKPGEMHDAEETLMKLLVIQPNNSSKTIRNKVWAISSQLVKT